MAKAPTNTNKSTKSTARNTLLTTDKSPIPQPEGHGPTETEKLAAEDKVRVFVPKAFKITLDDGDMVDIAAGEQKMPKSLAEHWYSKVNGVEIAED